MAKKLTYLSQIQQGSTVQSWHVSQSVDAFTGINDYAISISGSLNLTSSLSIKPDNLLTTGQSQLLSYNSTTGQVFRTNTSSLPDTTYDISTTEVGVGAGTSARINLSGSNDVNSFIQIIPGSNTTVGVNGGGAISISATAGVNGSSGSSGTSGVNGSSGSSGTSGAQGIEGSSGSSGNSGSSGSSGTSGATGTAGDIYKTTSTTAFTLGGAGSITVDTGLAYSPAQSIIIVNDTTHFQECEVVSYNSATGALVVATPTRTVGTGDFSSWTVNLDGATGGDGSSGSSGTSGNTGSSGSSGTSGEAGSSGSSGATGSSGSSGTSGDSGSSGSSGTSGDSGSSGSSGTSGDTGSSGSSGTSGDSGSSGSSGTSGDSGSSGSSGTSGFLTLTGNTVSSLITNDGDGTGTVEENLRFISNTQLQVTGSVSISGEILDGDGDAGTTGQVLSSTGSSLNWIDAASGATGSSGSSGTSGDSGSSGSSGTSGEAGSSGSSGTSGDSGSSGSSGTSGDTGSSGSSGTSGDTGSSGSSGTSGEAGSSGSSGTSGEAGSSGSSGTSGAGGDAGDLYRTTSTTTFTLGVSGTLTVSTGLAYSVAQSIIIVHDISNFQECEVTTYNSATGALAFQTPTRTVGSGEYSTWTVNLDGASGGNGSSGSSGTSGEAGSSGSSGTSGEAGSSGSSGTSGEAGSSGSSGTSGDSGSSGSSGTSGDSGSSGSSGTSGDSGSSGSSGTSGDSGSSGSSGTSGDSGSSGSSGTSGDSGSSGSSGTSGDSGSSGSSGTSGDSGSSGSSGTSGDSGSSGSSGTSGDSGSSGSSGTSGDSGSSGSSGTSGEAGSSGSSGTSGEAGSSGSSGTSGNSGSSGSSGTSGGTGNPGSSGSSGTSGAATIQGNVDNNILTATGTSAISGSAKFTYNSATNEIGLKGGNTTFKGESIEGRLGEINFTNDVFDADDNGISILGGASVGIAAGAAAGTNDYAIAISVLGTSINATTNDYPFKINTRTTASQDFQMDSDLRLTDGKITIDQQVLTDASTVTWNLKSGSNSKVTLGGNRTLSITNAVTGDTGVVLVKQGSGTTHNLTLPGSSVIIGGGSYTTTTTSNGVDVLGVYYDGTNYYWSIPNGGATGATGSSGSSGASGSSGSSGTSGSSGASGAVTSFTTGANDRVVTATSTTGIKGESNLIYNATANSLTIVAGGLHVGSGITPTTVGKITATNDIVAFLSSDRRLKENIIPIPNALEKVMQINGVSFDWIPLTDEQEKTIHGNKGHDIGVIAQEIEAILPELVTTRDTGFKAVKYEKIVALLIEAIKELKAEINELKNK